MSRSTSTSLYRLKREGLNHPGPLLVESPIAMSSVKSSLT
jgi:hypothetical protein